MNFALRDSTAQRVHLNRWLALQEPTTLLKECPASTNAVSAPTTLTPSSLVQPAASLAVSSLCRRKVPTSVPVLVLIVATPLKMLPAVA